MFKTDFRSQGRLRQTLRGKNILSVSKYCQQWLPLQDECGSIGCSFIVWKSLLSFKGYGFLLLIKLAKPVVTNYRLSQSEDKVFGQQEMQATDIFFRSFKFWSADWYNWHLSARCQRPQSLCSLNNNARHSARLCLSKLLFVSNAREAFALIPAPHSRARGGCLSG